MQTVLSIIRELFAETTFQILWHAMHAGEISATGYSRDMQKKGPIEISPVRSCRTQFLSKKRAGGTQSYKNRRREKQ